MFWFYSNIIPTDPGVFTDVIFAKFGQNGIYGDLTGVYPSCTLIPEPSAIVQLLFGGVLLFHLRRKMK